MAFPFRKKKPPQPIDEERMRIIIQEELTMRDAVTQAIGDSERVAKLKRQRIHNLPKRQKMQLLRYLERRKAGNDKAKR